MLILACIYVIEFELLTNYYIKILKISFYTIYIFYFTILSINIFFLFLYVFLSVLNKLEKININKIL